MTAPPVQPVPPALPEDVLRRCVEAGLRRRRGPGAAVVSLDRAPFDQPTSYDAEVVTVHLSRGGELRIFAKNFARSRLHKDDAARQADREMHVYRDLLAGAGLGTAELCGVLWDGGARCLLLELVEGQLLSACGLDDWESAAAWLGDLHGTFARDSALLDACGFLAHHDEAFFADRAERALRSIDECSPARRPRLEAVLDVYEGAFVRMTSQPPTLVHGSYRPQNILVGRGPGPGPGPARIVAVDWEHAARGAGLLDLAFLVDGFRPPSLHRLLAAYRARAAAHAFALPGPEELGELLACFRLHKIVKSLGDAVDLRFEARAVARLVGLAEEVADVLRPTSVLSGAASRAHPAAAAWRALRPAGPQPERVEVVYESPSKERFVYRLYGAAGAADVIAKRCPRASAAVERVIYGEVLAGLPVPAPRCHGYLPEADGSGWLFLEDVGAVRLDPHQPGLRALAARWLGTLHTRAAGQRPAALPDRGPEHYRRLLRGAREDLEAGLDNPAVHAAGRIALVAVRRHLDDLEARWAEIEEACAILPCTLVHGDFRPKNVYVRPGPAGPELLPLDWEMAGWGSPAPDLAPGRRHQSWLADLEVYLETVRGRWSGLDLDRVCRVAGAGHALRTVAAVSWAGAGLRTRWPDKDLGRLRVYEASLAAMAAAPPWRSPA